MPARLSSAWSCRSLLSSFARARVTGSPQRREQQQQYACIPPVPIQESTPADRARCGSLNFEMLGQLQALRLVVRTDALSVERVGPSEHLLVDEAADDLPMLEDERNLARAHFKHRAAPLPAGTGIAEAGIE